MYYCSCWLFVAFVDYQMLFWVWIVLLMFESRVCCECFVGSDFVWLMLITCVLGTFTFECWAVWLCLCCLRIGVTGWLFRLSLVVLFVVYCTCLVGLFWIFAFDLNWCELFTDMVTLCLWFGARCELLIVLCGLLGGWLWMHWYCVGVVLLV